MTVADLIRDLRRQQRDAERVGTTAPVATLLAAVIDDLQLVDGTALPRMMTTSEAGDVLHLKSRTVARQCTAGRFPGAVKTSDGSGDWRIPADVVYRSVNSLPTRNRLQVAQ